MGAAIGGGGDGAPTEMHGAPVSAGAGAAATSTDGRGDTSGGVWTIAPGTGIEPAGARPEAMRSS